MVLIVQCAERMAAVLEGRVVVGDGGGLGFLLNGGVVSVGVC